MVWDAASMRTQAKRKGDAYILNGEKMWISLASIADYALVTVVTNPDAKKPSQRLSSFVVDLHSKGVTSGDLHGKLGVEPARQAGSISRMSKSQPRTASARKARASRSR